MDVEDAEVVVSGAGPAGLRCAAVPAATVRDASRSWVGSDHRDTASIQGALPSGRRPGRAVLCGVGASP